MNNRRRLVCVGLSLLASLSVARGASRFHVQRVRLPLTKTSPTIDGVVTDDEWAGAARMERFACQDGRLSPQEASFWVACDGKELFIAVVSETPPGGRILARATPLPENGDARHAWRDDSIEMVLDPLRTDTTGRRRLYHANFNARGAIYDTAYRLGGGGEAWRGRWRIASKVIGDQWHFEAALPLADMKVTGADLAKPFGIRLVRNWMQRATGPNQTEWSPLGGAYVTPDTLPVVTWDAKAPVVQVLQLRDPGKPVFRARIAVRNPSTKSTTVNATVNVVPKNSAHTTWDRTVTIAPGKATVLDVPATGTPGEELYTLIQVASSDGAAVYYLRDFVWKLQRPDPLWLLDPDAARKVDVSFAYFPYHNTIRAVVNVVGLADKDKVSGVTLSVRAKGGAKPLATTRMPAFRKFTTQTAWRIPPLKEGRYELVAQLDGVKVEPVVAEFVRHILPWERNRLGTSDVVVEPFEPIRVTGRIVHTVLRAHTLGDLGLWDQVESLGRPLLTSPMRLDVRVRGKTIKATVKRLRFVERKGTRVTCESSWSAGVLAGAARSRWDYDGMMTWALDIQPSKGAVDSMTLVIPLDDRLMPLFHACTDGIRFNHAGATPAGNGRVWNGSKAARNSIIGSYVPYIWLGAEERGLAVFGDNDRGWIRNTKVPCQELVRRGHTLELRLNLVAGPTRIEKPRRIVIGFQATPTKPMPDDWRIRGVNMHWHPDRQRNSQLFGCCYQYGALTGYDDVYPRDEDFTIYKKLAETRRTGTIDRAWLEKWIAHTRLPNEADRPSYRSNIRYGFHVCSTNPGRVLVYTNPRGMRHDTREGQTFLDEWHVNAFLSRKATYGGGSTYGANPVESFRDYSVWYYRKMIATFADDIYWDNTYLKACYDTVGTDAYELQPGVVQPSVGLWNMRALIRRTAVLQHEMNKRPMNMMHTTNAAIAPTMAFCHSHLVWEDRQGDSDFQDRFTRDYLRAESIGLQHGSVPFALILVRGPDAKKNEWAKRTAAGVLLVHELKPIVHIPEAYKACFLRLLAFGYGKPGVCVFNYWQAGHPVRVEGSDVATLVVSKPGRAMVIVCDYGHGGNLTVTVDTKALGLKPGFTATDAETGKVLPVANRAVTFPLERHDFRMITIQ